jgi:hypothetical protein
LQPQGLAEDLISLRRSAFARCEIAIAKCQD